MSRQPNTQWQCERCRSDIEPSADATFCPVCQHPIDLATPGGRIPAKTGKSNLTVLGSIVRFFRDYRSRTPWGFAWRIALESSFVGLAIALALYLLGVSTTHTLPYRNLGEFILSAIILAPILETFLLQSLPVGIIRLFNGSPTIQWVTTTLVFLLPHLPGGLIAALAGGLTGGLYLGYTYIFWRSHSFLKAVTTTIIAHTLHNVVVGAIIAASGGF